MGQDIYTKIENLKEEYSSSSITLKPKNIGEILVFSFLNVPKNSTLSHSKNYNQFDEETTLSYDELTEQASRNLKGRHIQEARRNLVRIDTSSIYSLDKLNQDINDLLLSHSDSAPRSIENLIYNSLTNNEDIIEIGKAILKGSKTYSKRASRSGHKGIEWKLFLEYNHIQKELLK